jgi:pyrroline-5-carboxylate reductase
MSRIAIIGGGNIGEALLSGLLRSGRGHAEIVVSERIPDRGQYLSEKYSVRVIGVAEAVENADLVVIAVKPSDIGPVTTEIAEAVARAERDRLFISVAAGVSTSYYESKLPAGAPVIRVMPNAPMLVGAGISAIAQGRFATADHVKEVAALFDSVGGALTVPESQLDAVTAVSGSGPAYFFLMVEALVDAAVEAGLSRPVATDLVVRTMSGSAAMLLERTENRPRPGDGESPASGPDGGAETAAAQLRAIVTSPGGTTAAGIRELERGNLREAVSAAVQAAKTRSEQLGITSE